MKKIKDYNKDMAEVGKFHYYGSMSPIGKKDNAFWELMDDPVIKQMQAGLNLLLGDRKAKGQIGKDELEKLGYRGSKSEVGNDYQMVNNSELIIDNIPTTNLQVVDDVVQKFMVLGKIYRGELTEEEERYFKVGALKFINGETVLDEDKYNQAMMAVL